MSEAEGTGVLPDGEALSEAEEVEGNMGLEVLKDFEEAAIDDPKARAEVIKVARLGYAAKLAAHGVPRMMALRLADAALAEPVDGKRPFASWALLKKHVQPVVRTGFFIRVTTPQGKRLEAGDKPVKGRRGVPPKPWSVADDHRVIQCQLRHPEAGRKIPLDYAITEQEYEAARERVKLVASGQGMKPAAERQKANAK